MDMIQDWMIINKIKMGDPDAWDILVHKYYDSVYFYCVRRCYGDCDIASDLTQDIFLKLVESLPRYRFIGKFQNYLYTMAVNTCNNYLKKRHIEQIELTDNFTTDLDTSLIDEILHDERKETVQKALDLLPEIQREVEPMLRILEKADSENQVKMWSSILENETYELVYYGRRSFGVMDGLRYLPGDADGDGVDQGSENFTQLFNGGEIVGFEVSLHMPAVKDITPVRYMMEPEYISQEVLDKEQMDEVKDVESWTVDQTDGSMYFFLDDKIGWRLVVADAAAGSRFYQLEKTADGGDTWEMANQNPFGGNLGVTEGLEFFDKNFGFAGLTGASQSHSSLYVTRDGGTTFTELQLPLETVTELPPLAKELNFTIENYKYCEMPKKKEDILTIKLLTGAGEIQGIRFESKDNGETWAYAGISVE